MHSEKDLKQMAQDYQNITIPKDLEKEMTIMLNQNDKKHNGLKGVGIVVAAAAILFTTGLNVSATFANSMKAIPIIGSVAQFLTFRVYENTNGTNSVEINSGKIQVTEQSTTAQVLNEKYAQQSKQLYEDFMAKTNAGQDHNSLFANYTIKADNGTTVSIQNATVETQASAMQTLRYDTVDLKNDRYITLPSLFKDTKYIQSISRNIQEQIQQQMKENPEKMYFTDDDQFKEIITDQPFYINNDHKLVIVFDEYAIAPGSMGNVEFVIQTNVIQDDLVSNEYVK